MPRRRFFPSASTVTASSPLLLAAVAIILILAGAPATTAAKPPQPSSNQAAGFLEAHNAARRAVGVPALRWDPRLEADARAYAAARGRSKACPLVHSHGGERYGENLFRGGGGGGWAPAAVVGAWVREQALYDRNTNTCRGGGGHAACGHYTQIVWRGTTAVGCAMAPCAGGAATFAVCRYSPPGNYVGVKPY